MNKYFCLCMGCRILCINGHLLKPKITQAVNFVVFFLLIYHKLAFYADYTE